MPSAIILVLCFLSFILGQLFSAYCTSLANVKIPVVTPQVIVGSEYSLQALLVIVLSVLVVHDLVLVLLLRHLLSSPTPTPKGILKLLTTVVHDVDVHTDNLAVVLFSRLTIGNSRAGYRKASILLPPRPATAFRIIAGVSFPLNECCTALVLFVKRDAHPPSLFSILACARVTIPPRVYSFPAQLLRHLAAAAISSTRRGTHLKKIAVKEYQEPVPVLIPPAQVPVHSQDGIPARPSHAPLLRHLVAAAILRKYRVRIVIEEDCHAGIEEVEEVDDLSDTLVVEEEKDGEKLDEQVEVTVDQDTLVLEEKVLEEQEEQVEEDSIEEQIEELTIDLESVAPSYQEFDLATPSYEEFANDAPPEPLFQKRIVAPLDHVIHRPPSLAAIAARMGVTLPSGHTRVSQLHLLARLSSRVSATSAEPISA
ncbi:hypothetical protein C8R44DRAFT_107629 [Mycena epipterygia]|nr:hypothetical protein C8R44DRAFT_107629 [Mycena epipterygia]